MGQDAQPDRIGRGAARRRNRSRAERAGRVRRQPRTRHRDGSGVDVLVEVEAVKPALSGNNSILLIADRRSGERGVRDGDGRGCAARSLEVAVPVVSRGNSVSTYGREGVGQRSSSVGDRLRRADLRPIGEESDCTARRSAAEDRGGKRQRRIGSVHRRCRAGAIASVGNRNRSAGERRVDVVASQRKRCDSTERGLHLQRPGECSENARSRGDRQQAVCCLIAVGSAVRRTHGEIRSASGDRVSRSSRSVTRREVDVHRLRRIVRPYVSKLRPRSNLADKAGLRIADKQVVVSILCDAIDTGAGQRRSREIAGTTLAKGGLCRGAAIAVAVGCGRTGCGGATGNHIHRLPGAIDAPHYAAAGVRKVDVAARVCDDSEDAADTEAALRPALQYFRWRPLDPSIEVGNPVRGNLDAVIDELIRNIDVSRRISRYGKWGIQLRGIRNGAVGNVAKGAAVCRGRRIRARRRPSAR